MNNTSRATAYLRNRTTLTPKQQRRINKKSHHPVTPNEALTILKELNGRAKIAARFAHDLNVTDVTVPVPEVVRAKVGIITYTGRVSIDPESGESMLHYETKGGVAKVAKKFTVID